MKRYWVAILNGKMLGSKRYNYREMQLMKACVKNLDWRECIEK